MQVWRICKRIYVDSSFSGDGGLKSPGRWHHRGNRIVYAAQSLSLAAWELFVHIEPEERPLTSYVAVAAEVSDDLTVQAIVEEELPRNWRDIEPPVMALRDLGTTWLNSLTTAIARVPSVVTPGEFNYLFNPLHQDFQRVILREPREFIFDPRAYK